VDLVERLLGIDVSALSDADKTLPAAVVRGKRGPGVDSIDSEATRA
jgi:hypothetical protein